MSMYPRLSGLALLWLLASLTGVQADELPSDAAKRIKQFETEAGVIQKKAEANIRARLHKLIDDLQALQDGYTKAGKLDEAVAIQDRLRQLKAGTASVMNPGADKAGNLLVNGSFEEGPKPDIEGYKRLEAGATDIKGWIVSRGQIDYTAAPWQHADGERSIDLHGGDGVVGGIKQTFATKKGQKYRVTFSLAGNPMRGPAEKVMEVSAAGEKKAFTFDITGKTVDRMGWETKTWEFTAVADETAIEFYAPMVKRAGWGPVIDNISVVTVDKATVAPKPVASKEDPVKRELERVQGTWKLIRIESSGGGMIFPWEGSNFSWKLDIKGDGYILIHERNGKESGRIENTFKCDPTQKPKTVDFKYGIWGRKTPYEGIYELEGDSLKLCFPTQEGQSRPKEVASKEAHYMLMIWEREKR